MRTYLNLHEEFVKAAIRGDYGVMPWAEVSAFHKEQLARMQHERLIHLMVTLSMALFMLLAIGFSIVHPSLGGAVLSTLLLILVSAYIVHYFRLENGVQRWYHLANRLDQLAGKPVPRYEGGRIERQ